MHSLARKHDDFSSESVLLLCYVSQTISYPNDIVNTCSLKKVIISVISSCYCGYTVKIIVIVHARFE